MQLILHSCVVQFMESAGEYLATKCIRNSV